ncbi:MATH and LRR domain-containing protein PFE0570w-like [Galleria mellonella]|uniref:MOG interacting and ectopic P-granules protein 1 n=1 Tax=Galleria mellonella TaxID=7137 RepID=A0A6J1WRT6_GALME|nr:MATH and LRR domain-containing protein PFE0570w-like [Galleria mellonella]XP_052752686.1 MATH and LRR domain-containing protein PFE0570w-like [Galleria mellonella]XP_052752688.1 MATH and LRR domain-containing protein PFE0570w-like [Galleria mellonella]
MNGTMEEPIETSLPNSPVNKHNHVKVTSEDCDDISNHCENSNNTESSNHVDSESSQGAVGSSNIEYLENDNSNDSGNAQTNNCTTGSLLNVPVRENSNNIPIENHNVNSNESYPDSVSSSQTKSETVGQENLQTMDENSKQESIEKVYTRSTDTNQEDTDELDSEEDSSDEGESEISHEQRAEDTVSINSDSEPDHGENNDNDGHIKNKSNDIIIVDNITNSQNGNSHDSPSPEVHEIESDNDDCVVANDEKLNSKVNENKVQLRRSSRAIKRKRYNDDDDDDLENGDESDVEEVVLEDPLTRKSKPIVINDTKALVEMAAKQMKSNHGNNQKKEPTVVIIDTNSIISGKSSGVQQGKNFTSTNSSINAQNLYQSIVARGTTVTPVSSRNNNISSLSGTTHTAQPSILPSLTDDMFVVEAPSFIVPYVYEKPSVKPFREFVDILGKELEDQRAKEEKERVEKEESEKRQKEKEKGETVEDSEGETEKEKDDSYAEENEEADKKKKKDQKKRERHNKNDDDASWDGESSADSDDELLSDEDKTVVIKDKADSIEEIKDVADLTVDKVCTGKTDNYFDCSLGKFFINIGLNLVQEYVQTDLLKQQNRKLYREKKSGQNTKATETSVASLMKNLEFSKENNAPYSFTQKKCEFCSFKTESMLVMTHHLETPHMKNNVYKCNFCTFEIRSPHDILYHMEAEHNIRGKLERAPAYHQCANCPFEDNGKGKLARHLIPCAKKFKPELNLSPPIEWEPPAKIPKMTRARNNIMSPYQNAFNRSQVGNNLRAPMNLPNLMAGVSTGYRPRGRSPMPVSPRATPVHGVPIIRSGVVVRHNSPTSQSILMSSNYSVTNNGKPKSMHQPSISITPLPRQPQPVQPPPTQQSKGAFVICEICDGYIKDLEQLRNHMQWIHKVKIHPKMIYNRPPLNCQKCQFRFFTDQGLERHLLGSHGLVTSSMQEAANKGKDAGRCPVCGRVYQWKLLNHVARDHNLTLKPAHLSYKCTVCTATFGMYKQFENHVYSAHSVVAKRVMDKTKTNLPPVKSNNDSLLKPLKINDEITIIPQPNKSSTPTLAKEK